VAREWRYRLKMDSALVGVYLELEQKMLLVRAQNKSKDSTEEDTILDCMDVIWRKLSEKEIQYLNTQVEKPQ
jgi:hypothetical protein